MVTLTASIRKLDPDYQTSNINQPMGPAQGS